MNLLWVAFLASGSTVAFILFVLLLRRQPLVATITASVVAVISWEFPQLPALVNVSGNNVYALDIFSTALLVIALFQFKRLWENMGNLGWTWILFGMTIFGSLLRGIGTYGLGPAVNEFRDFYYVYSILTWTMTLTWNVEIVKINIKWASMVTGWLLILVTLYHISRYGMGGVSDFVDDGSGVLQTTRPLTSGQAYVLAISAVICIWYWKTDARKIFALSSLCFGIAIIITQQRTVWGIVIAALLAVTIFAKTRTRATIFIAGVLASITGAVIISTNSIDTVLSKVSSAAENTQTYAARISSWQDLIDESVGRGLGTVVFGAPMGQGYGRFESAGRWVDFAPHNWYLTVYLRIGIIGLFFLLLFLMGILLSAVRSRSNMAALAIFVMMIVYGWSYSWIWYTAIVSGWAIVHLHAAGSRTRMNFAHLDLGVSVMENARN